MFWGRRGASAHISWKGIKIQENHPRSSQISQKPPFSPIYSLFTFGDFAISVHFGPPPQKRKTYYLLGGGQKSRNDQETITATRNTYFETVVVLNKAGFNWGPPRGPHSHFYDFFENPRFRHVSTFHEMS